MMLIILSIFLLLSLSVNIFGGILFVRYVKRLFQYDELFQMLQDDLDVNIQNFDRLNSTPLLSNAPEIIHASKVMKSMRDNLHQYAMKIEENAHRGGAEPLIPRANRGPEDVLRS